MAHRRAKRFGSVRGRRTWAARLLALTVVVAGGIGAVTAQAAGTDRLGAGQGLGVGGQLVSPSGAYRGIVQADGNLVVYGPTGATWSTRSTGAGARLVMQADGNLVMYASGRAVFSTSTFGSPQAAVLQDDGNFVVYGSGRALWSSRSGKITSDPAVTSVGSTLGGGLPATLSVNQQLVSPSGRYRGVMQTDGNFVVYGPTGALWWTGTRGADARLVIQADGNLVVYASGRAVFSTSSFGWSPSAVLQDDGNFVVYGSSRALWSWRTGRIAAATVGDGDWLVGSQVPAGTYRVLGASSPTCAWRRLKGFSGSYTDWLGSNFSPAYGVVTIKPTDLGFGSSGCGTWVQGLSPVKAATAPAGDGMWAVGVDLAPGTWQASGGTKCSWQRDADFSGEFHSIVGVGGGATVQILATDASFRTTGCGTWTKVG